MPLLVVDDLPIVDTSTVSWFLFHLEFFMVMIGFEIDIDCGLIEKAIKQWQSSYADYLSDKVAFVVTWSGMCHLHKFKKTVVFHYVVLFPIMCNRNYRCL